jgi:uncharacterized protein (DUF1697 family)
MPRQVAFLRAINAGGHTVTMAELHTQFEALGFTGVETLGASGNVLFESRSTAPVALERKIERQLERALGYEVATFLRSDAELAEIARFAAFPAAQREAARAFNVGLLKAELGAPARARVTGLETELDALRVRGRELFWLCRVKQSESSFSNAVPERALGIRATFRSMSTIAKLAAKYPPRR